MHVDVEYFVARKREVSDSRLFDGFTQGNLTHVRISVGVPSGLKPQPELFVVRQKRRRALVIQNPRRARDVPFEQRALKTAGVRRHERAHPGQRRVLTLGDPFGLRVAIQRVEKRASMHTQADSGSAIAGLPRRTIRGKSRTICAVVDPMGWLALLFIVVPVVELALLIRLGGFLGLFPTLALIMLTGIIGARLARQQGLSVLQRFQAETQAGRLPGDAIMDGAIILFSGALLLTPGILTDIAGFIGLIPPAREAIKRALRASMKRAVENGSVRMQTFVVSGGPPRYEAPHVPHGRPTDPRIHGRGGPVIDITADEPAKKEEKTD